MKWSQLLVSLFIVLWASGCTQIWVMAGHAEYDENLPEPPMIAEDAVFIYGQVRFASVFDFEHARYVVNESIREEVWGRIFLKGNITSYASQQALKHNTNPLAPVITDVASVKGKQPIIWRRWWSKHDKTDTQASYLVVKNYQFPKSEIIRILNKRR